MSTCFDLWKKDPFFPAAEEVQESADRMESVYRRWIRERKHPLNSTADLRRELQAALGTAKWQLEELERAVGLNDDACSAGEITRTRHIQFVEAIGNVISRVEDSLKLSDFQEGKKAGLSWVRLDEGERDELACFLSGALPPLPRREKVILPVEELKVQRMPLVMNGDNSAECVENSRLLIRPGELETKGEKADGHRRAISAGADTGAWKIMVPNEDEGHVPSPRKAPSFSCLAKLLDSTTNNILPKTGYRKLKGGDQHREEESISLHNQQITQGLNACYGRSKSYLSSCGDESYDSQLYGWLGVLRRQMQRSQYQIQYRRSIQIIMWTFLAIFLIVISIVSFISFS